MLELVEGLKERQENLEKIATRNSIELQEKQEKLDRIFGRLDQLENGNSSQNSMLNSSGPAVGFSALISGTSEEQYPGGSILPFNNVLTNIGDAYNPETRLFTCPVDGLYMFSVNVQVSSDVNGQIAADIISSRVGQLAQVWAINYSTEDYAAASTVVSAECFSGERIFVQAVVTCSVLASRDVNVFSGVLVSELI